MIARIGELIHEMRRVAKMLIIRLTFENNLVISVSAIRRIDLSLPIFWCLVIKKEKKNLLFNFLNRVPQKRQFCDSNFLLFTKILQGFMLFENQLRALTALENACISIFSLQVYCPWKRKCQHNFSLSTFILLSDRNSSHDYKWYYFG